jgi:hypothetical protein
VATPWRRIAWKKMVAALEAHQEGGLCECGLEVIDENGFAH